MAGMGLPPTKKSAYANLSGCTDIRQASHFAFHCLTNQMFYAVGGKVYRVDLTSANPAADLQFDLGETITCLKFYLYLEPANEMRTYDLIIGSDAGGNDGGNLRIYDASDISVKLPSTPKESYSGFATIVDVIYREQQAMN